MRRVERQINQLLGDGEAAECRCAEETSDHETLNRLRELKHEECADPACEIKLEPYGFRWLRVSKTPGC